MNLFILDENPTKAALLYCDKHLTKIVLEASQMLTAAHLANEEELPFTIKVNKSAMNNHVTRWVRENLANYKWTAAHLRALCYEYTYRQRKIHKWQDMAHWLCSNPPQKIDSCIQRTPFAQAVDDDSKQEDAVKAYRHYYNTIKQSMCKWTNRAVPRWFELQTVGANG